MWIKIIIIIIPIKHDTHPFHKNYIKIWYFIICISSHLILTWKKIMFTSVKVNLVKSRSFLLETQDSYGPFRYFWAGESSIEPLDFVNHLMGSQHRGTIIGIWRTKWPRKFIIKQFLILRYILEAWHICQVSVYLETSRDKIHNQFMDVVGV